MKPNVMIQLGSFAKDAKLLELFSYPEGIFDSPDSGCLLEVWASGKHREHRLQQGADAINALGKGHFNEAFLTYGKQVWRRDRLTEVDLYKRITISPRHPLWMPPFFHDSETLSRDEKSSRATHQIFHNSVCWNDIRSYPTMIMILLCIGKNWDYWEEEEFFGDLVDLVWQGLSSRVSELCMFGAMDFSMSNLPFISITENMASWPQSIPLLNHRFDALHPILFGKESLCLHLRDALKPHLGHEPEIRRKGSFAMLVLGRDVDKSLAEHEEVARFLVPREGKPGQVRSADETLGEYALGEEGRVRFYIEKKRFIELYGPEALAYQHASVIHWETIESQICTEAGAKPAAVIVAYSISETVVEARRKIRLRFEELDSTVPPAQRVWQAHEAVFREMGEHLFGSEKMEAIELISRYFFEGGSKGEE